jgi:hypothetical protein
VLQEKIISPGHQSLLYDIKRIKDKSKPKVLCAASRVYSEKMTANGYAFVTRSPSHTQNAMRILLPAKPAAVIVKDVSGKQVDSKHEWDASTKTLLLQFVNDADGISVGLKW